MGKVMGLRPHIISRRDSQKNYPIANRFKCFGWRFFIPPHDQKIRINLRRIGKYHIYECDIDRIFVFPKIK
ncbi:hypothetical protein LEP1GSC051_0726 [Leptospira sp. P2653]|nr:hypothetical protein LEP1GSC051_0726 [Leptospira sp. P2653]